MNTTNATARPEIDGAALTLLTEHRNGAALNELSAAAREVAKAVEAHGKPGTVTLKLSLSVAQNTCGTLLISHEVTIKKPKAPAPASIFFADEHYNLVRNDPNQNELPLKIAETTAQPTTLKTVAA